MLDGPVDPVASWWSGTGTGEAAPTTPPGIRLRQGIGPARPSASSPGCVATAGRNTAIGKSACIDVGDRRLVAGNLSHEAAICAPGGVPFAPQASARAASRPDVPPGLPLR